MVTVYDYTKYTTVTPSVGNKIKKKFCFHQTRADQMRVGWLENVHAGCIFSFHVYYQGLST